MLSVTVPLHLSRYHPTGRRELDFVAGIFREPSDGFNG
jgi:hypothetical protein